jgi:large subunit ribosomal protein L5
VTAAAVPSTPAAPVPVPAVAGPRAIRVLKVVVNAGVGESGDPRTKAVKVLEMITHQKPVPTRSKTTNRDFGIREGQEIGAKVTLRGAAAREFLNRALDARDRQLDPASIDKMGNFSFGLPDYTDLAGMKYDPQIGIRGMDICVALGRAGHRIQDRRSRTRSLPRSQRISKEEAHLFLAEQLRVVFLE